MNPCDKKHGWQLDFPGWRCPAVDIPDTCSVLQWEYREAGNGIRKRLAHTSFALVLQVTYPLSQYMGKRSLQFDVSALETMQTRPTKSYPRSELSLLSACIIKKEETVVYRFVQFIFAKLTKKWHNIVTYG